MKKKVKKTLNKQLGIRRVYIRVCVCVCNIMIIIQDKVFIIYTCNI